MSETAVVRIYATSQEPDYDSPWQARTPSSSTGSGVVIGDGLILTGAHVVANSTFLQAQKISDPNKVVASVQGICHDCDLALLRVDSEGFMDGIAAATIGDLPDLRDRVSVVGFPVGGEEVSFTEGVVSRIEVQRYSHSQRHLLAVTVDAAINQGNSGGPVFKDGNVVGIAFQKLSGADNIGEMVPSPLIRSFLSAIESEQRPRVPGLGVTVQGLENPHMRTHVGIADDDSGILILNIEEGNSASGILEPGDALLEIDGHPIANNATIRYRGRYRTRYDALLGEKRVGDKLPVRVLRNGEKLGLELELKPLELLVPRSQYDQEPPYFVCGGLVFQRLSRDFLTTWDSWWDKAPKEFLHLYYSGSRSAERQEVVIISQILADEINVGYEDLFSESVTAVNGKQPRNLAEFVGMVDASGDMLEIRTSSDGRIVLSRQAAERADTKILARYHIPRDRSRGLPQRPSEVSTAN